MNTAERLSPPGWPEGRPLAVTASVMVEGWSDGHGPASPAVNILPPGVPDTAGLGWGRFGLEAGIDRLLLALDTTQTTAVFYISGIVAEKRPDVVKTIADAGHPIAAHSWVQNELPGTFDEAGEAAMIRRCADALEAAAGIRPSGWLSPRVTPSQRTTELLAGEGYTWQADSFDIDFPIVKDVGGTQFVSVPFAGEFADLPTTIRHGLPPAQLTERLGRAIDHWPTSGLGSAIVGFVAHAHVFGRALGALETQLFLQRAQGAESTWVTTHQELAERALAAAGGAS